jgi:hypothetical protein
VFYYFQAQGICKIKNHDESACSEEISIVMNRGIQIALGILISHYVQQYERSVLTIQSELILKHQTQL